MPIANPTQWASGPGLLHEASIAELESLGGEVLTDLLALFFQQAAGLVSEIGRAADGADAAAVRQAAHKLKGSSRTLGAARVADLASELEAAALTGDLTVAGDLLDSLRRGLDETSKAFRSRMATR
jgi:HPt (histidine-containing phosphotransfer) domain-containing protein